MSPSSSRFISAILSAGIDLWDEKVGQYREHDVDHLPTRLLVFDQIMKVATVPRRPPITMDPIASGT